MSLFFFAFIVLLAAFVPPESIWRSLQVALTLALHKRLPLEVDPVPPFRALSRLAELELLVFAELPLQPLQSHRRSYSTLPF